MKEMHIRSFAKTISGLNPLSNFRIAQSFHMRIGSMEEETSQAPSECV